MLPFSYCAATALLLCPLAAAFSPHPSQQQQQQRRRQPRYTPHHGGSVLATTPQPATTTTATTISSTSQPSSPGPRRAGRPVTELLAAAGDRGGGGLEGAGNDGDGGAEGGPGGKGKRKPPRSVLERPWDVEVDFHGERRVITVQPGDSILEAAEMSGMNLSYECRRGSCISCAAKVQEGSSGHFENRADRRTEDGAPEGFVLTCSTVPTGPGVMLELSANHDMWEAYCARLDDVSTQDILRQTSAGLMTKYRKEHPDFFREEVERQFKKPS